MVQIIPFQDIPGHSPHAKSEEYETEEIEQYVDAEQCVVSMCDIGSGEAQCYCNWVTTRNIILNNSPQCLVAIYIDFIEVQLCLLAWIGFYEVQLCLLAWIGSNEVQRCRLAWAGSDVDLLVTRLSKVIDTIDAYPFIDKLSAQFKDDPIGNKDKKTLEQAKSFKLNIVNPTSFDEDIGEDTSLTVKIKGTLKLACALINRPLIVWICLAMLMKGVRGDTYIYSEPNKTVTVNGQATLMCKYVTNATTQDLMSLTWSRKGNSVLRIRPGIKATPGTGYEGRVAFASGKNDASLKIGPVYHNDSGTYRCTVSISDENGGTQYAETELLVEDAVTTTQHADLVSTTSDKPVPPPPPPPKLWMRFVGSIFCIWVIILEVGAFIVGHQYRHYEFKESDFTCADACTRISNILRPCVLLVMYCIFMMIGIGVLIGLWTATSEHDVQVLLVISIVTCLLLLLIIINQSVVTQCGRRPKERIKNCHVGHLDVNLKFRVCHVTQESVDLNKQSQPGDAGEPV